MVFFWNCGGSLSKAQITENVMNTLEESVGKTVTVEGYPASVGRHQGDYQEVITFFPTVGMGSPEGQMFYVIKEIGKLEEPPMKSGAQYQKVGKYRMTGEVTKRDSIEIEGLAIDLLGEQFVIDATHIALLPE